MFASPKFNVTSIALLGSIFVLLSLITYFQYASYNTLLTSTPTRSPLRVGIGASPYKRRRGVASTPAPHPNSTFSFRLEEEDHCAGWTFRGVLFPSKEQRLELYENASLLYGNWDGLIPLDIFYPFKKACSRGTVVTKEQKSAILDRHNTLCTYDRADAARAKMQDTERTTLIYEMIQDKRAWEHIVRDEEDIGLNLWHFHVDYFPLWLAIRRLEVTAHLLMKNETFTKMKGVVFPDRMKPIIDIVFVFPDAELRRFQADYITTPVVYDGSNALDLYENGGKYSSLAGIQGIHDGLHPESKVIIARYSTTTEELQKVFREEELNPRPAAWVRPSLPTYLMWMLERSDLEGEIDQCKDSVFAQYSTQLLNSIPIQHKTRRATHVCFVSRQNRAIIGASQPFASRNLVPDVFLEIVKRLSAPIVLSPHIFVRDFEADPIPTHLQKTSVTGQMRFVHQECAVLVGVHGAGLANLFGLRRGAHLIEFVSEFNYTIFKNSALLLNNVSYTRIFFEADLLSRDYHLEANFRLPEDKLVAAIDVINKALEDSLAKQRVFNREEKALRLKNADGDNEDLDDDEYEYDEDDDEDVDGGDE